MSRIFPSIVLTPLPASIIGLLFCVIIALFGPAKGWANQEVAKRIVAIGDVHGAYEELIELLQGNGLIDEQHRWSGGSTTLVSLGDLLDRGPRSRAAMDLLMRLQREAPSTGGAVHMLLGNHESMNLIGDLRDVSTAEYAAFADDPLPANVEIDPARPPGYYQHRTAFSAEGKYGRWLLQQPSLLKLGDTLFAHGGLPPMIRQYDINGLNKLLRKTLHDQLATNREFVTQPPPAI